MRYTNRTAIICDRIDAALPQIVDNSHTFSAFIQANVLTIKIINKFESCMTTLESNCSATTELRCFYTKRQLKKCWGFKIAIAIYIYSFIKLGLFLFQFFPEDCLR